MKLRAFAAIILCAAAAGLMAAEKTAPPLAVSAAFKGESEGSALLPVSFLAPVATSDVGGAGGCRLAGPGSAFLCQAVPAGKPQPGDVQWYDFAALLPHCDQAYVLDWTNEPLPEGVPIVASMVEGRDAVLDTGEVLISLDRGRLNVFNEVQVEASSLVPRYVTNLINVQQGVKLVLSDRIRHVDFTLEPDAAPECTLETVGPVVTTALYRGTFIAEHVNPVKYEARVSLIADGIAGFDLRLPKGSYDSEVFVAKAVKITVPIVLQRAAALSFGGAGTCTDGREFWMGRARLAVSDKGSYEFAEGDNASVSGGGKTSWAAYADGEAGLGLAWGTRQYPVELTADYNEDLLDLSLTPRADGDTPARATLYFAFKPLHNLTAVLPGISEALDSPPTVTVSDEYIEALPGIPPAK